MGKHTPPVVFEQYSLAPQFCVPHQPVVPPELLLVDPPVELALLELLELPLLLDDAVEVFAPLDEVLLRECAPLDVPSLPPGAGALGADPLAAAVSAVQTAFSGSPGTSAATALPHATNKTAPPRTSHDVISQSC